MYTIQSLLRSRAGGVVFAIFAAVATAGCAKEEASLGARSDKEFSIRASHSVSVNRSGEDFKGFESCDMIDDMRTEGTSRTAIGGETAQGGSYVYWTAGDKIGVRSVSGGNLNSEFTAVAADGTSSAATFTGEGLAEGNYIAYYPYNASAVSPAGVVFNLPSMQLHNGSTAGKCSNFKNYDFCYTPQTTAVSSGSLSADVSFSHAFTMLEIYFKPYEISNPGNVNQAIQCVVLADEGPTSSFYTAATLNNDGSVSYSSPVNYMMLNVSNMSVNTFSQTSLCMMVAIPAEASGNNITITVITSAGSKTIHRTIPAGGMLPGARYTVGVYDYDKVIEFDNYYTGFRDFCIANYDTNLDDEVTYGEVRNVKTLNLEGNQSVWELRGIEAFRSLENLLCCDSGIGYDQDHDGDPGYYMDLSMLKRLKVLDISHTEVHDYDIGSNLIQTINCSYCPYLCWAGASNAPHLTELNASHSGSSVYISMSLLNCPSLTSLTVSQEIVYISVKNCTALENLDCSDCYLLNSGGFVISGCTSLKKADFNGCVILDVLNLSSCTALQELDISNMDCLYEGGINLSGCSQLCKIKAVNTPFDELDLSGCFQGGIEVRSSTGYITNLYVTLAQLNDGGSLFVNCPVPTLK